MNAYATYAQAKEKIFDGIFFGFFVMLIWVAWMFSRLLSDQPDPQPKFPLPNGDEGDGYGPRPWDDQDQT